ncbi:AbiV family abortive infection protein [Actinophytocola algeriensis]|uniref:AbiV family abortive infection protein n=1 Tax=Actinophytocola algeriensis TaxID=1768010 RepID=A0A7W7QBT9_9PSEU|nr:AbiV family abortive infection protein [Actinophytocola algeriensis]MBB4910553.1 AbiV family abortive infection protein [Actinophytocola algeriensis]MBE1480458.1 AbiV family abortive infection protein [Actinophytocola algeriensis]
MARPLPSFAELLHTARHAIANAAALLQDAELLLSHHRWPRAHALAVLALEEVGKAGICLGALGYQEDQAQDFWLEFRDHKAKLHFAGAALQVLFGSEGQAEALVALVAAAQTEATSEHAQKLRGFYVDLDRQSGAILRPEAIDEAAASRTIERVEAMLNLLGPAWLTEGIEARLDEVITCHSDDLRRLAEQARELVLVDTEAAVGMGRRLLVGNLPPVADEGC